MAALDQLVHNLCSPMILAFALGVVARLVRSDLAIPEAMSKALAIFLLLAIGMKGGEALDAVSLDTVVNGLLATLALGICIPLWSYVIARRIGGFDVPDAASLAGHYGSTSAVTFLAALTYLNSVNQPAEGFMPALLAVMEVPAIVIALVLLRRFQAADQLTETTSLGHVVGRVLASKSILLLIGGILIGWAAGREGMAEVHAFFVDPFKGVLCLFLLDLGMVAASQVTAVQARWRFLLPFALGMPLIHGALGVLAGHAAGLSIGGTTVLATLAASASYIAAPAAMRVANPEANHALPLAASLGLTFLFNLALGIPLYHQLAIALAG